MGVRVHGRKEHYDGGRRRRANLVAAGFVRSARDEERVDDLVGLRAFGGLEVGQV